MAVTEQQLKPFLEPWRILWDHYAANPWQWTLDCVRTRNEDAAPGEPRELVPVPPLPHLEVLAWAGYAVKLLVVDKSRQMMATWWLNWTHIHEAMFQESANIGYQHMTSADTSQKLEKYFLYVLRNQPLDAMLPWVEDRAHPPEEWVQVVAAEFDLSMSPRNPDNLRADQPASYGSEAYDVAKSICNRYTTKSGPEGVEEIVLEPYFSPSKRYVMAIPAGAKGPNKWRGDTRTRASEDEAWFHFDLANNVNSANKSIGQNGRQTLITTASLGEDGDEYPLKMIEPHPVQPETFGGFGGWPTRTARDMPEGVEIKLTKMGYTHIRIHHYADPAKRSDEWKKANIETGDRRKNLREVLIHYSAPIGDPFYPSYDHQQQAAARPSSADGAQLLLFMDGGRRPASGAALCYPDGRVHVITELVTPQRLSSNVSAHVSALVGMLNRDALTRDLWRGATCVCDPSMFDTRGETDDVTSADVLIAAGLVPVRGSQNADRRYNAVTNLNLQRLPGDGRPALLVDPAHAPTLHEALSGACTVTKAAERTSQNVKTKDGFSHITDALEYLATYIDAAPIQDEDDMSALLKMVHTPAR